MAAYVRVDRKLVEEAVQIGNQPTKKAAVEEASREYIDRRQRVKALNLFGKIDFDPQYDYKAERKKR